jgi:TolB-like protein/Tfp pilus assembly protein PilF
MRSPTFFAELQRRNVYKVAVAYAVVGWLVMQVCATVVPALHLPDALTTTVVVVVLLGFPIALVLAWAFEVTPEGIKRTEEVTPDESITQATGRKLITFTVAGAVVAAALLVWQFARPKPTAVSMAPGKSIAVLPFDNLSEDKANAYFAEGVQDEILTRLAKVADLKVISRTSTQHFKSAPENLPEIARQLGVANILEGSVQRSGDAVRVNVQLIKASNDAHLWADIFDRKLTDIFAVESDIAKAIADKLEAKLTGSEMTAMTTHAAEDPVAYELCVKGRHFLSLRRGDNLPRAIECFQQAIGHDANYGLAYASLSEAYILLPRYTPADPRDTRRKARAAAQKALELNPNLAEAHNALGKIAYDDDLDFTESTREFRRAIELNPNYAGAHHWFSGGPLESTGKFDEAVAEAKRATELDPLSAVNLVDAARIFTFAHRFAEADATFKKAIALDPEFFYAHWHYGEMLDIAGKTKEAGAEYAKAAYEKDRPEPIALLGQLAAKTGHPEKAREALVALEELGRQRHVDIYWRALLYVSLGDKEQALKALEQSYADREGYCIGVIKVDSMLDSLRGDPRFETLVREVTGARVAEKL